MCASPVLFLAVAAKEISHMPLKVWEQVACNKAKLHVCGIERDELEGRIFPENTI